MYITPSVRRSTDESNTFAGSDLMGGEVVEDLVQRHVHPHPVLVGEVLGRCLRQQGVSANRTI